MAIVTLGLDLGKSWIHMVGLDGTGRIALRRRVKRDRLSALTGNMPACLIGMEACCGAHHLGRALEAQGHRVRLMPPPYVKPFVKTNKNDYRDAEANAEAVQRPTIDPPPLNWSTSYHQGTEDRRWQSSVTNPKKLSLSCAR